MVLGGTGSPIWSIMAAPTEHPNTPQRIHPGDQLTKTQPSSAMPHNQHLTATPQTQTRYKRKQRVYHCLYCPRCHHRSTWDTWAISAENDKPAARFSFGLCPVPFIKGSLIPGILKFIPCEESTPLERSVKFQRKLTTNQKITTNHTTNKTTNQTDFPQSFVPRRSSHYLWQHHPFWRPEIYRSTEDNG